MLQYLDYLVFSHAVFCTEQLYAIRRIIFSMFFKKKKVKNNLLTLHGLQTYQNGGSSKCSYMSTLWCFCTRFFAQNNSMHSVESFSACFCEKKKLKITCSFCMGYRLTKMEDLQNPVTSRLFGVFARGILHRTTLCIPQNHFQHVFAKKKVQKKPAHFAQAIDLPKWRIFKMLSYLDYLVFLQAVFCTEQLYAFRRIIFSMFLRKKKLKKTCSFCMGYRLTKMEDLQNPVTSRLFGVFARGILHRTTLCIPQNHFQHVFEKKSSKKTCSFCIGYRLTKMEDLQNALISRLFGVFASGFLHRTTLCIPQNHFQHVFAKKKVENNLPILHGLQTYQNGGSSKCSHISTIWCFCTRFFAQNNSMHSVESFSACFCEKKS